ncbi:hypothetical protein BJ912DRAFT_929258 [Pholiota molesta]|nr:hypothetical protein BJ912DRAFT_929258 [Pholiota molesta]
MSTTTALSLAEKAQHLSTLDVERKVFSILDAYLQPSSAISATTAAEAIATLFPPGSVDYDPLLHLWDLFIAVDRLVALIKTLRDLPDPTTITIVDWGNGPTKLGLISQFLKQSRIRDINFQAFAARLTTEGVIDISKLAVFRLRDVLEEDPDHYIEGYNEVGPHLDTGILPANVWITLASKLIFGFCKANGEGASRNHMGGGNTGKECRLFCRTMGVLEAEIGRNSNKRRGE